MNAIKLTFRVSLAISLLSCRSESTTSENIVWRCSYEGQTGSGLTLSAQWVASEHRCWWDGGGERRPKTAEKFGSCGVSLYGKEPFLLQTAMLKDQAPPMPYACDFSLQGESISLSFSDANEMTVRFGDEAPQTVACSVTTQFLVSHGNCTRDSAGIQTRSVFKEGVDIFYAGTCSEGVAIKPQADSGTYQKADIERHMWVYEKGAASAQAFQDQCLADGHGFARDPSVRYIYEGSCIQKIDGGLVASISYNGERLECPDPFEIFQIMPHP